MTSYESFESYESYELGSFIGEGAYGKVVLGLDRKTLEHCAVKKVLKNFKPGKYSIRNEKRILKLLNHESIVKYINYIESKDTAFLFLEYCPG